MKRSIFVTSIVVFCASLLMVTPVIGEIPYFRSGDNRFAKESASNMDTDITSATDQDNGSVYAPATIYDDSDENTSQTSNGTQNITKNDVNLYLNGPTSVKPAGGNMMLIYLGYLVTLKPTGSSDTSVRCLPQWTWAVRGHDPKMYFCVGGFIAPTATSIDIEGMSIELWATGRARGVQFLLVFGDTLKIKTDEKDVSGPTKFIGENKTFKMSARGGSSLEVLVYARTAYSQVMPFDLIYGSAEHPSRITPKITNPMNATFTNLSISKNSVYVNATLKDAFGTYDIVNYTFNVRGPQIPKSIKELSKKVTGASINIVYEIEYEKADGEAYQISFICKDNNGNTWETNATANSTFVLKQTEENGYYYYAGGGAIAAIAILAVWKFRKSKSKLQTAKKRRTPHKAKG